MSAKSTVTCRVSPSRVSSAVSRLPHFPQKLKSTGISVAHLGQVTVRGMGRSLVRRMTQSVSTECATKSPIQVSFGVLDPRWRGLTIGLVLNVTFVAFEALAIATVMPLVADDLSGLALYGWVFSSFLLADLVGIVLAGELADRSGPAVPFGVGLVLFAIGLLLGGLAPSMPVLVAARAIQGFGAGAIPAGAYVVLGRTYPDSLRPRMFAILSTPCVVLGIAGHAHGPLRTSSGRARERAAHVRVLRCRCFRPAHGHIASRRERSRLGAGVNGGHGRVDERCVDSGTDGSRRRARATRPRWVSSRDGRDAWNGARARRCGTRLVGDPRVGNRGPRHRDGLLVDLARGASARVRWKRGRHGFVDAARRRARQRTRHRAGCGRGGDLGRESRRGGAGRCGDRWARGGERDRRGRDRRAAPRLVSPATTG